MTYFSEASFFRRLLDQNGIQPKLILVIGCGTGDEPHYVQHATNAFVVAVDLEIRQKPSDSDALQLLQANAEILPFRTSTFDAIYCYHTLEHVRRDQTAISEMQRVLAMKGIAFVGTPNKLRLIGYIAGRNTTLHNFFIWNLHDYWMRLTFRWANDKGAHAGFSDNELRGMLTHRFSCVENVSLGYYASKFPKVQKLWSLIFKLHLEPFIAQSLYYIAMKL